MWGVILTCDYLMNGCITLWIGVACVDVMVRTWTICLEHCDVA